ncbi:MAG: phage Gp37/Gp68 family protein [Planctomycetaceae bacterium]|nr:phage Gp37/Gp68 family protein [Planctomycetaceae bacterium]
MSQGTKIEYLDRTWNPIAMRCDPVSPGCEHCWHLAMARRHAGNPKLSPELRAARGGGPAFLLERELMEPLRWKEPQVVGVEYMGDWLHEQVKPEWIDRILEVMGACPQHTFLTLTKRIVNYQEKVYGVTIECGCRELGGGDYLPNHWNGVTLCNQAEADEKLPLLLRTLAGLLWVSLEPLLGPVDFTVKCPPAWRPILRRDLVGFVVVGPEVVNGKPGRPCELAWIKRVVDQCHAAEVPVFAKAVAMGKEIIKDIDRIAEILSLAPESLRQWPTTGQEGAKAPCLMKS